jgi:hypothetical protein
MAASAERSAWASFTGRLPEALQRDAQDLALVFNRSLNDLLFEGVGTYVAAQLANPVVRAAVQRMRVARAVAPEVGETASVRRRGDRTRAPRRR